MSYRTYAAFNVDKRKVNRKINRLEGDAYDEFITYPIITLNNNCEVKWIVAACHPFDLDRRLRHIETRRAPMPYRVTMINDHQILLYWCLKHPVKLSLSGWRKQETYYKSTYISFCKAFKLDMVQFHFFARNPLYIGYKTGLVTDEDYDIKDFSIGIKNCRNKNFYFDARDYIFKVTGEYARKAYRDFKPKPEERGKFTRLILDYMEEINVDNWPDIHTVSYEDVAEYIINYLFTYYDSIIEEFPTIQSKRASNKGFRQRDAFLQQVLDLRMEGYGYKRIARATGVDISTVKRWIRKHGASLEKHDAEFNRVLSL